MSWTLQDKLYDGLNNPKVGYTVQAAPASSALFELQSDSLLHETTTPYPSSVTDGTGQYSLTLPLQSEQNPTTNKWIIGPMPDGTYWAGLPPTTAGTYSLTQLINSWGWGQVSTGTPIVVVAGPAAVIGFKAGVPSDADYTTPPQLGSFVIDTTNSKLWVRYAVGVWKGVVIS